MISAIFNSAIMDSAILHKKNLLIHSDSTWWWQPSWILPYWIQTLPSWIETPWYLLSDSLKNTLTPFWLWLKLIQSDSNSFILTQIDDCSHLEFCHLGFSHFAQKKTSLVHSDSTWWLQLCWILPSWIQPFCTKRTSLIHSHSTWWYQPSWILPSWIQLFCTKKNFTHTYQVCFPLFSPKKNFTHSFWLNLMMAAILNSAMLDSDTAILDSDILLSFLRLTQKHSPSTLTLTQANSIWLTRWWQPSWILLSWIQPFCLPKNVDICNPQFSHFA